MKRLGPLAALAALGTFGVAAHAQTAPTAVEVLIVPGPGDQMIGNLVPDGTGGHYVTFSQRRDAAVAHSADAYVQRVGGSAAWAAPIRVSNGTESYASPYVFRTRSGIVVVYRSMARFFVQRYSPAGAALWSTPKQAPPNVRMIHQVHGIGDGAYVVYEGYTGTGGTALYAARVDEDGAMTFKRELAPVVTTSEPTDLLPHSCVTPQGDLVAATGGNHVIVRRIDPTGRSVWGGDTGLAMTTAFGVKQSVSVSCDTKGGVDVGWVDARRGADRRDPYVQHVDPTARPTMTAGGVLVVENGFGIEVASDESGGIFVVYNRKIPLPPPRQAFEIPRLHLAHLDGRGSFVFGAGGGQLLEPEGFASREMRIASDGKGGAFVSWQADATAAGRPVGCLAMRWLDGAGTNVWGPAPVRTGQCNAYPNNARLLVADGEVILGWDDPRSGYRDVYRTTLAAAGARAAPVPPAPPPPAKEMPPAGTALTPPPRVNLPSNLGTGPQLPPGASPTFRLPPPPPPPPPPKKN